MRTLSRDFRRAAVPRSRFLTGAQLALGSCDWSRWLTQSGWPDLVVGFALACLFPHSAVGVSVDALRELRGGGMKTA